MNNPHQIPMSWEDLDQLLGELREADAALGQKKAKRDAAVAQISTDFGLQIEELQFARDSVENRIKDFLVAHKDEFPRPGEDGRFRDLIHGRVGFRQAAPKLATLRNLTEDEVVEFMLADKRRFSRYLRTKVSLDKPAILSEMPKETLEEVGLALSQEDNCFVAPRKA